MAYTKTTWNTGDVITAEKLNHMEDGITSASGYDIVFTRTEEGLTADGASFEELLNGGEKKASYILIEGTGKTYSQSLSYSPSNFVSFDFFDTFELTINDIALNQNGNYSIRTIFLQSEHQPSIENGTYTYSNGHYVFTPSGSGT